MSKVFAFVADGLEEVECLAVVDVLRRSGVDTELVSVMGRKDITGAHGIHFQADVLFEEVNTDEADVLFLPGGMPGTSNLKAHEGLSEAICRKITGPFPAMPLSRPICALIPWCVCAGRSFRHSILYLRSISI